MEPTRGLADFFVILLSSDEAGIHFQPSSLRCLSLYAAYASKHPRKMPRTLRPIPAKQKNGGPIGQARKSYIIREKQK